MSGIFKVLDIERSKTDINITLIKYYHFILMHLCIHVTGKMTFNLDKGVKRDNLVSDSHEFNGPVEIK
jgi:hypothetical protein